jgi:hypothetical protein
MPYDRGSERPAPVLEDSMTAAKTLLAVPSAVAALALVGPSPALAITGYAGAPTAVAAQYPASANSQTPGSPGSQAPSLSPKPNTPVSSNSETPGTSPSQSGTPTGNGNGNGGPAQPARQIVASASPVGTLPFTCYAAIAAIAAGLALLLGGLAVRRAGRA